MYKSGESEKHARITSTRIYGDVFVGRIRRDVCRVIIARRRPSLTLPSYNCRRKTYIIIFPYTRRGDISSERCRSKLRRRIVRLRA